MTFLVFIFAEWVYITFWWMKFHKHTWRSVLLKFNAWLRAKYILPGLFFFFFLNWYVNLPVIQMLLLCLYLTNLHCLIWNSWRVTRNSNIFILRWLELNNITAKWNLRYTKLKSKEMKKVQICTWSSANWGFHIWL